MNSAIELHDSDCLQIEAMDDGTGFVLLNAWVHRSEGRPGCEAGEAGMQRVRLSFEEMAIEGLVGELPAEIYEGSLEDGGVIFDNVIGLPSSYSGKTVLKLMLSEDARVLTVSGASLILRTDGEFRYIERFPGSQEFLSH